MCVNVVIMLHYIIFCFDFVSVLLGLSFGVYTISVTISCIFYFVFTISLHFIAFY